MSIVTKKNNEFCPIPFFCMMKFSLGNVHLSSGLLWDFISNRRLEETMKACHDHGLR